MPSKGQINDMYKQLQEVMNKCDNLSHEIVVLKKEHRKEKEKLNTRIIELENANKVFLYFLLAPVLRMYYHIEKGGVLYECETIYVSF